MQKIYQRINNLSLPFLKKLKSFPLISILFCILFLVTWKITLQLEDPKYIAVFLFFPFIFQFIKKLEKNQNSDDVSSVSSTSSKIFCAVFFIYIFYTLCNWYFLSYPYYGTRSMTYLWFCFLSFLLGAFFLSQLKSFSAFCFGCIISGVIASLYSFGEYLAFIPYFSPESWPPRITGLFAHKNAFGFFIMNSSVLTAYLIFYGNLKKWNPLLIVALLIQLFALFTSDSRGTLVLTGAGFVGIFLPLFIKSGIFKNSKMRYSLYAVFFLCSLIPLFIWDEYFWLRIANMTLLSGPETQTRFALYIAEWKLFLAHPVFGCGVGNFVFENIPLWPETLRKALSAFVLAQNAESDFLETLTETGLVGFAFYCFFLFGAVYLGIRELKRERKRETYIVLVLFILMLCNGIYDTPIRRLPCAIIFWSFAGYFWRHHFMTSWRQSEQKTRFIIQGSMIAIHCIIAVFFIRILVGDFYYMHSLKTGKNPHTYSGKQIQRALAVCPFHPEALYQAAYIGIRTKEYDFTMRIADRLIQLAPNYQPTSFLKGRCALGQKRYADALSYANEEIRKNPNYLSAYELKVKALAGLGKCKEMSQLQDTLCIPLKDENAFIRGIDTLSGTTLKKMYIEQTGRLRALAGGNRLKEAYRRYIGINRSRQADNFKQLHRISAISCNRQIKE